MANNMAEDFVAEVTYLEYLQEKGRMNDNHVFCNNDFQEQKEIQLYSVHHRLSSENLSHDTTFKTGRTKLGLQT